jgi:hypothetical protein
MTKYDPGRLDELGARRTRLRLDLKAVNDELAIEISRALKAGVIQADIVRRTGMSRETVAQLTLPKDRRWQRARAHGDPA